VTIDPDLADIRHHWGSAYAIAHPEPDTWIALRRDTRELLRADNPHGLRALLQLDYLVRPVPRDIAP
jgi:hypothetical protein